MSKASMSMLVAFLALAGSGFGTLPATAADAPAKAVPITSFFQNDTFSDAALSPNGRNLAIRVATRESRAQLAVLALDTMALTQVGATATGDVGSFAWVNNDRLVYRITDLRHDKFEYVAGRGLFAINRDGRAERELKTGGTLMGATMTSDRDDVFVWAAESNEGNDLGHFRIERLNTKTGNKTVIDTPWDAVEYAFDRKNELRVVLARDKNQYALRYRDQANGPWRTLASFEANSTASIHPLLFGPDGVLYVSARNGRDKSAVYRYDLAANKLDGEPLVASEQFDVAGHFITDAAKVLGFRYQIDAEVTTWFDPAMKAFQLAVDAQLGATTNRLSRGERSETPFVLVEAFSDVQPSKYYLFNSDTGKLTKLGEANADIDPARMSLKDLVRYKARDGLEIPAYLTLPKDGSGKNLPLVVLVHGGPFMRGGYWSFDEEAQFLASRGYAVLQPEFRGSAGFGARHFRAGWKQWGLAMQDDLADGAKWAIAQGYADPKRICIAGASYGGYATLMGLIKDPELFKCGINWIGVTDIEMMYSVRGSDFGGNWKTYGMPLLVGDRVKDAAQLKATSPLQNAARLRQPLLMAYGRDDRRVPLVHGTRFRDAVKAGNPDVEWVVYDEEGHGWGNLKTRLDFWNRVEKFLERHIGKP
ncbi:MAG: prolyl oligopeptidase family serine peptidase [Pseudomonadota bacterium]